MSEQAKFRVGLVLGLIWAVVLLWGAARFVKLPMFTVMPTIMTAFLAPGLVIVAMIGRVASRRLFDGEMVDGRLFEARSKGAIDQKVLTNTIEQLVAALCIWPAAAILLAGNGPGVIIWLWGLVLPLRGWRFGRGIIGHRRCGPLVLARAFILRCLSVYGPCGSLQPDLGRGRIC
ncbi:MAG: hypothetical protein Q9M48_01810 [Rhodobacterales bacterium]|nr:hypothetical protein [Rhodobacterales bacterium]